MKPSTIAVSEMVETKANALSRSWRRRLAEGRIMALPTLFAAVVGSATITIAAPAAAAVSGLERVQATSLDSGDEGSATANCPGGKFVVGAGASISNGQGKVVLEGVVPGSHSVVAKAHTTDPYPADWSVTAIAMCAYAPSGLELKPRTSINNSVDKRVQADCPLGKLLIGMGYE